MSQRPIDTIERSPRAARDAAARASAAAGDLRAQVAEGWAAIERGEGDAVDVHALAEADRQAEALERALPRLQIAAQAEQEAEHVAEYHARLSTFLGPYSAQSEAVRAALADADRALLALAQAAAEHQQITGEILAVPEPRTVAAERGYYTRRSERLVVDGAQLHEIDPGDAILAAAGAALALLPGNPWPQYREEFQRIRAGLPAFAQVEAP